MRVGDFAALCRPRISLAVGGATLFGALLAGGGGALRVGAAVAGAVALCAGCSALNQVQERRRDALMARTADRPLPAGRAGVREALAAASALGGAGLALFALGGGAVLFLLGLAVVLLYNGLYTPLKPVTPGALLVGGLAGALPPLCGWVAAGGAPGAPVILAVTGMVYLWQVPHFWLLAERRRAEYRLAGFPLPGAVLPPRACRLLMALWTGAYCVGLFLAVALAAAGHDRAGGFGAMLAAGLAVAGVAASARGARALAAVNVSMLLAMAGMLLAVSPF